MESFVTKLQKKFELLLRLREVCNQGHEAEIQQLVECLRHCQRRWRNAEVELMTSRSLLGKATAEQTTQDVRLRHARNQLDLEIRRRHNAELVNQQLERQIQLIREILMNDEAIVGAMDEEQKTLLTFLSSRNYPSSDSSKRASGGAEVSGSTLSHSGISYDRTDEEQLDTEPLVMRPNKPKNKDKRCSGRAVVAAPPVIARRSRCRRSELFVGDSMTGTSTGVEVERKQTPRACFAAETLQLQPSPLH
uniref:Rac GTPase-activating protein 1-like n=1 Tax=Callorhinchus milii TaxID=7868 RepID=A0A4W3GFR3_CALMI|eukprot:gi/632988030/ref/XP_007882885.1/ PREDICTED: rac GTPase-activating protein 1-like [Callorhinchus milii]